MDVPRWVHSEDLADHIMMRGYGKCEHCGKRFERGTHFVCSGDTVTGGYRNSTVAIVSSGRRQVVSYQTFRDSSHRVA